MNTDNGPKDGDFASYLEALARARPVLPMNESDDNAMGRTAPHAASGQTREVAARDSTSDRPLHRPPTESERRPVRTVHGGVTGAESSSGGQVPGASAVADFKAALHWGMRIVGALLIFWGVFAMPLSIGLIVIGSMLVGLSFREKTVRDRT